MHASIFSELSLIIALAAGVSIVMRLLKQPLIIGHILTGVIVGPAMLHWINTPDTVEVFSSIGIALLLFIIGLGLNPRVIKEVGKDPRKALLNYPDIYKKRFGYQEGLVYLQFYSKVDEHSVITGSYSIDAGDAVSLRSVLARREMHIPETVSDDEWLDYAQESEMSSDEADQFARNLRAEYYRLVGANEVRLSISTFLAEHDDIIQTIFDTYYPELAKATYSTKNSPVLQDLARSILGSDIVSLRPEVRQTLIKIGNSSKFDDEAAKTMDSIIRYAAVEELRKSLSFTKSKMFVAQPGPTTHAQVAINSAFIHNMVAHNIQAGVLAGRSYGGCPGNIELGLSGIEKLLAIETPSPQEAYGGKIGEEQEDQYGSLTFKCPNGHTNRRPYNQLIPHCKTCGTSVKC